MGQNVKVGETYRHYKGAIYTVIGLATHTETNELLVIYTREGSPHWARPISMWSDIVQDSSGEEVTRFIPVSKDENLIRFLHSGRGE